MYLQPLLIFIDGFQIILSDGYFCTPSFIYLTKSPCIKGFRSPEKKIGIIITILVLHREAENSAQQHKAPKDFSSG